MKTKVALIGANGQLGSDLVRTFKTEEDIKVFPLTHEEIEVADVKNFTKVLLRISPNIIINTAAYHKVDEVETNPEKAFLVNSVANKNLAEFCNKTNVTFVFLSTDYVFGLDKKRSKPYKEQDLPGPINVYGISKLAGENFIRYVCQKYFIVRTSGLFGRAGCSGKGGNFIETMLRVAKESGQAKVVDDQILTPTYTVDLANQIALLIRTRSYGTYHVTSEGNCSWYEFAKEIFKLTKTKVDLKPVTSSDLPTIAKRPSFSVLENYNLKKIGLNRMRHWEKGLADYLKEKKYIG